MYFTMAALPAAHPLSVASLLSTHAIGAGPTIGAILSETGGTNLNLGTFAAAMAGLNGGAWGLDLTFGLVSGADYFEADVRDHDGASVAPTPGVIDLGDVDGDGWINEFDDVAGAGVGAIMTPGLAQTGAEAGGFSIMVNNTLIPFVKVNAPNLAGSMAPFVDVALSPDTSLIQATSGQVADGWQFADQSIFALKPVPEPASVFVWVLLVGLVAGHGVWRRNRK